MLCERLNTRFEDSVQFVSDPPFNDRRYSISWDKISKLGWAPKHSLKRDIPMLVDWYRKHADAVREKLKDLA